MPVDPKTLPPDAETLKRMLVDVTAQLDRTERLLRQLLEAKTGRKSEQLTREQLALFAAEAGLAIAPEAAQPDQDDSDDPPPSATGGNRPRGRKALPRHLERERVEHDLAEVEKHCAHAYLSEIQAQLLPKSEAGQAVAYALKNWTALTRYCENPDLAIDNNATERSLRCFAVGLSNWTFFGSDRGGRTAAVLRSFVTSCELVRVDPFDWFRDVLSRIAAHPVTWLDQLLPHRWAPAAAIRNSISKESFSQCST